MTTTTGPMSNIPVYDPTVAATKTTASSANGTSAADLTQNFLKLLIAQIQNQDPMSPMDASAMTAQMSQLNMVSSMGNMNISMTAMLNQMQSVNFMNQASLIGHSPVVAGNSISFDGTSPVILGANAANPLSSAIATITDTNGNVVNSAALGALAVGMKNFAWDGKDVSGNTVAAGLYSIRINGTNTTGGAESPTAYVASPVASISKGTNGDSLFTLLDGRQINSSTIQQWIN
jgi:flagellar basal-body rod modification protein FlgD